MSPDVTLPVRLAGAPGLAAGRLEVYYNHTWGTVCGDLFGDTEAAVVCGALGRPYQGSVSRQADHPAVAPAPGPVWLAAVDCGGGEASLAACTHAPWGAAGLCDHDDDVFVRCDHHVPAPLELRLADGPSRWEGRVEVKRQGRWGSVCRDRLFDDQAAAVICRTLGAR